MKQLALLAALAAFSGAAVADPGNGLGLGLGLDNRTDVDVNVDNDVDVNVDNDVDVNVDNDVRVDNDVDVRTSANNFNSVSNMQHQSQTANGGAGGSATSYGSTASTGASTSQATVGNTTATASAAPSTSSATGGNSSVGNVAASVGAVVEEGAVQSSTSVTTNYREAAQGVAIVLTTACGTAASGSGRSFTFGAAQGQDAFCKDLALAKVFFDLGQNERGMEFVEAAAKLVKVDNFFDQITTVLTLGILK
jgi:hypothetical protein